MKFACHYELRDNPYSTYSVYALDLFDLEDLENVPEASISDALDTIKTTDQLYIDAPCKAESVKSAIFC